MPDPEHLKILKQGVAAWNVWRNESSVHPYLREAELNGEDLSWANLTSVNLKDADLRGANLFEADLSEANLRGANLAGANLERARLNLAELKGANLSSASLRDANLYDAELGSANLRQANLTGASLFLTSLTDADLSEADLTNARFVETVLGNTNLRNVKGLESCVHHGPSTIDHRTLERSGPLSVVFLRGCGLSDQLIEYLPSLLHQAVQFYSCFISYSTKDQEFAERLHADLQSKGVRCWFAPHNMSGGKKIHEQIDEAIRLHERLLLILSDSSIHSEWVRTEISKATKREIKERRRVLFPVRLVPFEDLLNWDFFDADTGKDSAREIREYFIPDFSAWKDHDSYKRAFDRLLTDLKA